MEAEGVVFHYGVEVGRTKTFASLQNEFDAVLCAGGAEEPRDPKLPRARTFKASTTPMPYLTQQNRRVGGESFDDSVPPWWPQASMSW
jgi:glutamate synthase (NADPH/NADH) small chain